MDNSKLLGTFILATLIFVAGCKPSADKLHSEISTMENSLYTDTAMIPDPTLTSKMINLYTSFVQEFPSDTSSPSYLFRAADLAAKTNEIQTAVDLFEKLRNDYPGHRNAPFALFLQGFIYENQSGDPMKAKPYYDQFLSTYPDHPIAGDVAFSLENLGKTPEELIKQFEMSADTLNGLGSENTTGN